MKKLESVDAKAVVLANIGAAISESNDREQTQAVLAQSVAIAGEIQKSAEVVMQQAIAMANQLEDGEQKAAAIQQIVSTLEQDGIGHFTQLQFDLATLYHEGRHLPKDIAQAAKWYRKAAAQGHAPAQINLAMMYIGGDGVKADPAEARKWFTQAADQGDAEGQVALGMMFALGQGVEADLVQAYKWVTLSSKSGNANAVTALEQLTGKLSPEQLAASARLVKEWEDRQPTPAPAPVEPAAKAPEPPATAGK
jgi:TPR repeat protein